MTTRITKSFAEMHPFHKVIPKLETLNLSMVLNSIVVCRVCRGQRVVAVKSSVEDHFTFTQCYLCKGSGTMSNRESHYEN